MSKLQAIVVSVVIVLMAIWGYSSLASSNQLGAQPKRPYLVIKDQVVTLDLAADPAAHARGLSGADPLPDNHGMLFIFPRSAQGSFWMKDMKFALDIIWIANNQIVDIHKQVPPPNLTQNIPQVVSPSAPYTHVLEVTGGWADQNGVEVGSVVEFYLSP